MPDAHNPDTLPRIGVYVCHCGTNIAATIDVPALAEYAAGLPDVVVAREYKYICSDPGQELIRQDIREHNLTRIVVASCSPLMHGPTFRGALVRAGINAFFLQMVNIREHVSWVHTNKEEATAKAKDLVRAAVRRVRLHKPLEKRRVEIKPEVLVVGGGIAGIHAALTIANSGKHVYLVERQPTIGGHMAQFDKTFPTLDCAACILTPKMTAVGSHPATVRSMWRFLTPLFLLSFAAAQSSIDSTEYQARRRAAMEKIPGGIIALHSVSGLKHWEESGSHQDASFFAFTGLANARGAVLVLDGTEGKSWLFVMPRPKMFGPEFGSDLRGSDAAFVDPGPEAETALKIDHVVLWDTFVSFVDSRRKTNPKPVVYVDSAGQTGDLSGNVSDPPGMAAIENPHLLWRDAIHQQRSDLLRRRNKGLQVHCCQVG